MPAARRVTGGAPSAAALVIPVHGSAPYLEAALRSVAAQTLPIAEVVVVDDRAAEGLEERVVAVLPSARVVTSEAPGLAAARNTGIASTEAPFVTFLDADDLWLAGKNERQLHTLLDSPEAAVACSAVLEFTDGRVTAVRPRRTRFRYGDALEAVMLDHIVNVSAVTCRRKPLEATGGFPPERTYFEDFALFSRLARVGPFVFDPKPLALYRQHPAQMTRLVANGVLEGRSELTGEVLSGLAAPVPPRLRRRVAAHDHLVAGQWHRRQGRRRPALAHAGRAVALWPLEAGPYALAGFTLAPPRLERRLRALVQERRALENVSPAVRQALDCDRPDTA